MDAIERRSDAPQMPPRPGGCAFAGDDLIALLYQELPDAEMRRMRDHLLTCAPCRTEFATLEETLRIVDAAGLPQLKAKDPGDLWPGLRTRLASSAGSSWPGAGGRQLLRAAGIVFLVGASFWLGSAWRSSRENRETAGALPGPAFSAEDESARLLQFARETNGYLNRSRLVLLAFSNASEGEEAEDLSRATGSLLREADRARRLAKEMRDPRLQQLVTSLEQVLGEIARITASGDDATRTQLRESVSLSSVLDQLELLAGSRGRASTERPHA